MRISDWSSDVCSSDLKYYEKLNLGNKATKEATSVTTEFAVKNQNLAATLDKISKWFHAQVSSQTVKTFLNSVAVGFTRLIGIADTAFESLTNQYRVRSEEHTSELQSLMRNAYAV